MASQLARLGRSASSPPRSADRRYGTVLYCSGDTSRRRPGHVTNYRRLGSVVTSEFHRSPRPAPASPSTQEKSGSVEGTAQPDGRDGHRSRPALSPSTQEKKSLHHASCPCHVGRTHATWLRLHWLRRRPSFRQILWLHHTASVWSAVHSTSRVGAIGLHGDAALCRCHLSRASRVAHWHARYHRSRLPAAHLSSRQREGSRHVQAWRMHQRGALAHTSSADVANLALHGRTGPRQRASAQSGAGFPARRSAFEGAAAARRPRPLLAAPARRRESCPAKCRAALRRRRCAFEQHEQPAALPEAGLVEGGARRARGRATGPAHVPEGRPARGEWW